MIDLFKIIREGTKAVPATKYALGVAGIIAVVSLLVSIGIDWRIAFWGFFILIAMMTLLLVFAQLTKVAPATFLMPVQFLMWAIVILFIVICVLLTTSVFFKIPVDLQHVLTGMGLSESYTSKRKVEYTNDLLDLINDADSKKELMVQLNNDKNLLPKFLKSKTAYESLTYTYNLSLNGETIDLVLFYHYNEQTQAPHYIFLTKFYDIDVNNLNWEELDADWNKISQTYDYEALRTKLAQTNGFNSPIEFPHPMGHDNYRPVIVYLQVCGRRGKLNSVDLSKMQNLNSNSHNGLHRFPITYDFLLSGLSGLF